MIGTVSATDLNNTDDNLNLLNANNDFENLTYDSITETIVYEENALLKAQYGFEDMLHANDTQETSLTGNDTELYFRNGTSFKVLLSDSDGPLANQNVIFNVNENNYTRVTNNDGIASIEINLIPGEYDITSFFTGNEMYSPSSTTNTVKVLSTIRGKDIEKYYKNNTQYYAAFVDGQGNFLIDTMVTFNINGVFYQRKTDENGIAKLNINLNSGKYTLTATSPINGEMHSDNITVLSTINGKDVVKYYKNGTQYYASFLTSTGSPLANTNVSFNINGVFYTPTTNNEGIARLNINLNPNNYTITAINPINGELYSNNIEVLPTIAANDLTMNYRNGKFVAKALDDEGNPSLDDSITFNINGVFYNRATDNEGNAYLNINLNVGRYIITSTNSKGLSASNIITINRATTTITGENARVIVNTGRNYAVTLMGENNMPIDSSAVHFRYNNHAVDAITDKNGRATININNLPIGSYPIDYWYDGNMNYYPSESKSTLTVAESTVILSGKDLNMVYKDGSEFNITLTDLEKKPLANETITILLNGATYNRITNDQGMVSIGINLIPGTYTIDYSHSDENATDYNAQSNTIVVNKLHAEFITKDLVFNYGEDADFIAKLVDINNNPIKNTQICFNINGVEYYRTTNDSGIAKIHINLLTGYYDISTSLDNEIYAAKSKSNHILVNGTFLTGNDLTLIAGLSRDYSVTLLNAYGKPISNAVIEFRYNGISKRANTNAQGVATITVGGLAKGDYSIIYEYVKGKNTGQSNIHVSQSVLNSKNKISDLSPYLSSSKNCQVSNSEIVSLAKKLTANYANPLDKAIAIFNYVRDQIPYSYYYDTKYGAVGTLHAKTGNCVDQSHLSIALYRAAGLPARYVHGVCTFSDGDVTGHVWAQVLIGDTWVVSDAINVRNSLGEVVNWNNNNYKLHGYYSYINF